MKNPNDQHAASDIGHSCLVIWPLSPNYLEFGHCPIFQGANDSWLSRSSW